LSRQPLRSGQRRYHRSRGWHGGVARRNVSRWRCRAGALSVRVRPDDGVGRKLGRWARSARSSTCVRRGRRSPRPSRSSIDTKPPTSRRSPRRMFVSRVASGSSWARLPTTVNATMATATAQTTHLSTYGFGRSGWSSARRFGRCLRGRGLVRSGHVQRDGEGRLLSERVRSADRLGLHGVRQRTARSGRDVRSALALARRATTKNDCTTDTQTGSASTCNVRCQNVAKNVLERRQRSLLSGRVARLRTIPTARAAATGPSIPRPAKRAIHRETCPHGVRPRRVLERPDVHRLAGDLQRAVLDHAASVQRYDERWFAARPGCNTSPSNRDVDCASSCGNGIVDVGETLRSIVVVPDHLSSVGLHASHAWRMAERVRPNAKRPERRRRARTTTTAARAHATR